MRFIYRGSITIYKIMAATTVEEILQEIFAQLPYEDLLNCCAPVCKQWQNVIVDNPFYMPFRQLYYRYCKNSYSKFQSPIGNNGGINSTNSIKILKEIILKYPFPVITEFLKLIEYKKSCKIYNFNEDLLELHNHPMYLSATNYCIKFLKKYTISSWCIIALMAVISRDVSEIQYLMYLILKKSKFLSLVDIIDFFYGLCMMFLLHYYVYNLFYVQHYKIHSALFLWENRICTGDDYSITCERERVINHLFSNGTKDIIKVEYVTGVDINDILMQIFTRYNNRKFLIIKIGGDLSIIYQFKNVTLITTRDIFNNSLKIMYDCIIVLNTKIQKINEKDIIQLKPNTTKIMIFENSFYSKKWHSNNKNIEIPFWFDKKILEDLNPSLSSLESSLFRLVQSTKSQDLCWLMNSTLQFLDLESKFPRVFAIGERPSTMRIKLFKQENNIKIILVNSYICLYYYCDKYLKNKTITILTNKKNLKKDLNWLDKFQRKWFQAQQYIDISNIVNYKNFDPGSIYISLFSDIDEIDDIDEINNFSVQLCKNNPEYYLYSSIAIANNVKCIGWNTSFRHYTISSYMFTQLVTKKEFKNKKCFVCDKSLEDEILAFRIQFSKFKTPRFTYNDIFNDDDSVNYKCLPCDKFKYVKYFGRSYTYEELIHSVINMGHEDL